MTQINADKFRLRSSVLCLPIFVLRLPTSVFRLPSFILSVVRCWMFSVRCSMFDVPFKSIPPSAFCPLPSDLWLLASVLRPLASVYRLPCRATFQTTGGQVASAPHDGVHCGHLCVVVAGRSGSGAGGPQ